MMWDGWIKDIPDARADEMAEEEELGGCNQLRRQFFQGILARTVRAYVRPLVGHGIFAIGFEYWATEFSKLIV